MLAEDGVAEDLWRDGAVVRAIGARALHDPSGPGAVLWLVDLLIWSARRSFRRRED
jgi:hypothetical protein